MDPKSFTDQSYGQVEREAGNKWSFWYFNPAPLPRDLSLTMATVRALSDADNALGHLQGLGRLVTDPQLLLGPYVTREAVASSRIEGTETSLSQVLKSEASDAVTTDESVAEVERYVQATFEGLRLINELPLSRRLAEQVHAVLLQGVRGQEKLPGQFRHSPVWVGSPTNRPETAVYVPPLPDLLGEIFSDWERFVNERDGLPILIRCALMHYQFETIHPFLDGNGRIGRLLIVLLLVEAGRLPTPILYLSGYLEQHRREYYDRLQAVRERGEMQQWLQFFLTAVRETAADAVRRAGRLVVLRERYLAEARTARSNLMGLVEVLFRNPYVNVARAQRQLGLTGQGARNIIKAAEARGWLVPAGASGRGGRQHWVAADIFEIIEAPLRYLVDDAD